MGDDLIRKIIFLEILDCWVVTNDPKYTLLSGGYDMISLLDFFSYF